jgi:hypothetical protein
MFTYSVTQVGARGNFIFARQAMSLIERRTNLRGRLDRRGAHQPLAGVRGDRSALLHPFAGTLRAPRYEPRSRGMDAAVQGLGEPQEAQLLWALFDLVRHGQAHQYQQIMVELNDGTIWGISLTGATAGRTLATVRAARLSDHLSQMPGDGGSLWLVVRPDVMFLDFKSAIARARVFEQGLEPTPLSRRAKPGGNWDFSQTDLESAARCRSSRLGSPNAYLSSTTRTVRVGPAGVPHRRFPIPIRRPHGDFSELRFSC